MWGERFINLKDKEKLRKEAKMKTKPGNADFDNPSISEDDGGDEFAEELELEEDIE